MSDLAARIAENLHQVHERIDAAAVRSGRGEQDIELVAVTKYVGPAEIRAIVAAGCTTLGESRPQQLWERAEAAGRSADPLALHRPLAAQQNPPHAAACRR